MDDNQATDTSIIIPIALDDNPMSSLVDTGCSHSVVSCHLFPADEDLLPESGDVILANSSRVPRLQSSRIIRVSYGRRKFSTRFERMELPSQTQAIIGRDLLSMLGIGITGLLSPDQHPEVPVDDEIPHLSDGSSPHPEQSVIVEGIIDHVHRNLQSGTERFCSLPEAQVSIRWPVGMAYPWIRQYRLPQRWKGFVTQTVQDWLSKGVIEKAPIGCPVNNPLLTAPKREQDGSISKERCRVCLDIRSINRGMLENDRFPLPVIDDMFELLAGATIFSILDLDAAYNRFPIKVEDRFKTAFTWEGKQYQFGGAPFGLKHLPGHFQRIMSSVLSKHRQFCLVYIDDIIIFSPSTTEHLQHVRTVLDVLTELSLPINQLKSHFGLSSVVLLGHLISAKGIEIDRRKLLDVESWPVPQSSSQLQHFLGLFNYFRKFIPGYSVVTQPLDLVRHNFMWDKEQQKAWELIIVLLQQSPLLTFPDFGQDFFVGTDASRRGISAVLYQLDETGQKRYICFKSRALKGGEPRYSATKLECLAIVFALQSFRYYIYGRHFTIFCDHKALCYIYNEKEPNRVLATWLETLLEYDFTVVHLPGIQNTLNDHLSRIYPTESEARSKDVTVMGTSVTSIPSEEERLRLLHDHHALGHFGAKALAASLKSAKKYWPNIHQDCKNLVRSCIQCARHTIKKMGFHPVTSIHAQLPFDHLAIDLFDVGTTSFNGYNGVLIIVDVATRFVILRPYQTKSADEIARLIFTVMCNFGIPKVIQSDNGREFRNQLLKHLGKLAHTQLRFTTPYHPRGNGVVERYVQTATNTLKKLIRGEERDWEQYIPAVQLSMNLHVSSLHQSRPFSLFFGRAPAPFDDYRSVVPSEPQCAELNARITHMQDLVFPAIHEGVIERQKIAAEKLNSQRSLVDFPTGSWVMARDPRPKGKLAPIFEGPFKVMKRSLGGSYLLEDTDGVLLNRKFAPSQLTLVTPPDEVISNTSHLVEAILSHRGKPGRYEYLVKWANYDDDFNEWLSFEDFNDTEIIRQYWIVQKASKPKVKPRTSSRRGRVPRKITRSAKRK